LQHILVVGMNVTGLACKVLRLMDLLAKCAVTCPVMNNFFAAIL